MTGRNVVITGATSGIGVETAVGLARLGASVTIAVRNPTKGAQVIADIRRRSGSDLVDQVRLDLVDLDSVRSGAQELLDRLDDIHVLVNNAGIITDERRETRQGFEEMFGVNHLGHFLLTDLLTERLVASAPARVVVVSSVAHRLARGGLRFDDLQTTRVQDVPGLRTLEAGQRHVCPRACSPPRGHRSDRELPPPRNGPERLRQRR